MTPAAAKALSEAKAILNGERPPSTDCIYPMRWRQVDDYYAISDCGYKISRCKVSGEVVYDAWAPGSRHGDGHIGSFRGDGANVAAAECCENHRKGDRHE